MDILTQDKINGLAKKYLFNTKQAEFFKVKATGNRGLFEGWASTHEVDLGNERVLPGFFNDDLPKFLENPVMLFSHTMSLLIGQWKIAEEKDKGLWVEGSINLRTTLGRDTFALIEDKDARGLSIGYEVTLSEPNPTLGTLDLIKGRLWEISIVAIPMNQSAWIQGTKIFNIGADLKTDYRFIHEEKPENEEPETLAIDFLKLFGARGGFGNIDNGAKNEIFTHLAGHYLDNGFELPEIPAEAITEDNNILFDKIKLSEVKFKNNEDFIYESTNLKNNVLSIANILIHWKKEGRALPDEMVKSINELLEKQDVKKENKTENKAAEQKQINPQELKGLQETMMAAIEKITEYKRATSIEVLAAEFDRRLTEKLKKVTGKDF